MERRKADELMREASEEYQEDPRGWSYWMSRDPDNPEIYMIHNNEAYFMKVDSIYTPNPVGIGAKFKVKEDQLAESLAEFGFRHFSREEIKRFFEQVPNPEESSKREFRKKLREKGKQFKKEVMERKPEPFRPPEEPGEVAAVGPFASGDPLEYISDKQKKLKEDLDKELRRLHQREYPGYA